MSCNLTSPKGRDKSRIIINYYGLLATVQHFSKQVDDVSRVVRACVVVVVVAGWTVVQAVRLGVDLVAS